MKAYASASEKPRQYYVPGEGAPVSAIYRVHHGTGHREDHNAVILRAEELPACRFCKGDVQYVIEAQAIYITDDFDFVAPVELVFPPKKPAARISS